MFKKTYESITAGLQRMVDDLRAHAQEHEEQAADHRRAAETHLADADSKEAVAAKSHGTAAKIAALLDG